MNRNFEKLAEILVQELKYKDFNVFEKVALSPERL
jgi:hypothetical protein